ncbi:orexin receptor type 1-like [Stylophora pistillata]|uniref:orexin receptor type 1-like n=1 Tax=Stylophora pistillata TaxID=50429 RepID=UPI000C04D4C7|nr:orexin receptor type 1-like [Stylophora pistillata]
MTRATGTQSSAYQETMAVGKVVALSLILVVSTTGNVLVCYCGLRSPRMSAMNSLIVNLSIGELAIACVVIPLKIEREIVGEYLLGGPTICKLLEYAQSVALGSVTVTLLMISMDRLYSVFYPLSKITRRQAKYMGVFAWCYALLFANPVLYYFLGAKHQPQALLFSCDKHLALPWKDKLYSLIQLWAIFLLPIMIMTVTYFIVVSKLLKPDSATHSLNKIGAREGRPDVPINIHRRFTSSLRSNAVPLAKRKSVVMNLIVMATFIFCYAPLAAIYALETVGNPKKKSVEMFRDFASFLALGKLCANPAVYSFFDSNLRDQMCQCRQKSAQNSPVRQKIIYPGICTQGKLSELNVSNFGRLVDSKGQSTVFKEPLLRVSSGENPSPSAPGAKRDKLARLISNTRRYRSLGLSTWRSSNI